MTRSLLRSKIHGAAVTSADLDYEGSIMIDSALMEMAAIIPHEEVHVWNRTNGNRFVTYAIPAPPNSKTIMVNGAAAHLVTPGDRLIITTFGQFTPEEAKAHHPTVVLTNEQNVGQLKTPS